jgi:hypothetical protein
MKLEKDSHGLIQLGASLNMFNWLRKKEKDRTSITYYFDTDGVVKVDISMVDLEKKTINEMMEIFSVLAKDSCFIETLDFFNRSMNEQKRDDVSFELLVKFHQEILQKQKGALISKDTEPYIKPSQLYNLGKKNEEI